MVDKPAPEGMVVVTKDEFFAAIGRRDIMPHSSHPEYTVWETRDRREVGRTLPGWRCPGCPKVYMLSERLRP